MKLYLMQHGEAMSKAENPERPLTERGARDVRRMSEVLARSGMQLTEIRHSGKRRAEETARIVAHYFHVHEDGLVAVEGINPNDDVRPCAEDLQGQVESVMIVGHLPFLSRLTSSLLIGDAEQSLVQFQTGGVVSLMRQEGHWAVEWMVIPSIV